MRMRTAVLLLGLLFQVNGTEAMAKAICEEKAEPLGLSLPDGVHELKVKGTLRSIGRRNAEGYVRVKVQADDHQSSSFLVFLSGPAPAWLVKGAWLNVHLSNGRSGIHRTFHATVLDQSDNLLYASSSSGEAQWAPGWTVRASSEPGEEDPDTARVRRGLVFERGNQQVIVSAQCAEKVEIDGATYLLQGHTVAPSRKDNRPLRPDSSAYSSYAIQRL